MKYMMIAWQGLKKRKGDVVSLFLLISIATVMLYIGCSVLTNVQHVFDLINERNNGADVLIGTPYPNTDDVSRVLKQFDEIEKFEHKSALYTVSGEYRREDEDGEEMMMLIEPLQDGSEFFTPEIIDAPEHMPEHAIVLPYYLHVAEGYEVGDEMTIRVDQVSYECEVYGFSEDILFGTPTNISAYHLLVSDDLYDEMGKNLETFHLFRMRVAGTVSSEQMERELYIALDNQIEGLSQYYNLEMNYETLSMGAGITANILMAITVVFALLILLIAVVVSCYSIQNAIERNMANTGIMEAAGYTPTQLIICTLVENLYIAGLAIVVALAVSPLLSNQLGGVLASSIGVRWPQMFDIKSAVVTVAIVLLFILVTAYQKARKYKKISILDALRGDIKTHNFRKNHIPLEKTYLPRDLALGMKGIFNQRKNSIAICFIMIVLSLACSSGFFLYQNFVQSNESLLKMVGIEQADAQIVVPESYDIYEVGEELENIDGIEAIGYYMTNTVKLISSEAEMICQTDFWEDTGVMVTSTIVEGRYPKYENEIALSRPVCEHLDVTVGDMIRVESGEKQGEYLVAGMTQHINNLGIKAVMNVDGIQCLNENMRPNTLMLYHSKDATFSQIEKEVLEQYSDFELMDVKKMILSTCEGISTAIKALCIVFNVCTMIVVWLILFLMTRTKLVQEKTRLGVDKALGFTTPQLMLRIVMNYLPIVVAGSIIGAGIAYVSFEGLVSACLSSFGIRSCEMARSMWYLLLAVVMNTGVALLTTVLMSAKIRKIEPSRMIRE